MLGEKNWQQQFSFLCLNTSDRTTRKQILLASDTATRKQILLA